MKVVQKGRIEIKSFASTLLYSNPSKKSGLKAR